MASSLPRCFEWHVLSTTSGAIFSAWEEGLEKSQRTFVAECGGHAITTDNPIKENLVASYREQGSADSLQPSDPQGLTQLLRRAWPPATPFQWQSKLGFIPWDRPSCFRRTQDPPKGNTHSNAPHPIGWGSVGCAPQFLFAQSWFFPLLLRCDDRYQTPYTPNSIWASLSEN